MSGMISRALTALFKENEELIRSANAIGRLVFGRPHRRQVITDASTGAQTCVWQVEFPSRGDMDAFHEAIASIADSASGGEGE